MIDSAGAVRDGNRVRIYGLLDFTTVPAVTREAVALLADCSMATVNCSAVTGSNSAGLALLLELSRIMREKQCSISFQAVPDSIQHMASAYGITRAGQRLEDCLG